MPDRHCPAPIWRTRRLLLRLGPAGLASALSALPSWASAAQEHLVVIAHHEFEPWSFTPRVGDTLRFSNRSDIAHNLYLTYADGEVVTLDTQPPGTDRTTTIARAGKLVVKCWIHPVIRMELNVGPPA